ncbi:hypothetical protein CRE_06732 [Caenorhabditis remanei]|uniref:Uncharacterized protein n=1 Tax=Caenorhabditis remanei TaxID=31234 RepID=E3MNT8_CAERE|nr:hypothetical protein CRE_06732 [Caenorhabditis remanei]
MGLDSVKKWWNNEAENKEKSWDITGRLGSAASTVKIYSISAAMSVGSTASETVASTSSAIKNSTVSAVSSIGNSAKDFSISAATSIGNGAKSAVASTSSVIKESTVSAACSIGDSAKAAFTSTSTTVAKGLGSASSGVWNWWNGEKEKEPKRIRWIPNSWRNDSDSMEKDNENNSGWGYLGSAASTVRDYSVSAVSTFGSTAKSALNSDAVQSTSKVIKESTVSAASSIGNSAKSAWNSDIVASTSSTVSSGLSSAASGVKTWWYKEDQKNEEVSIFRVRILKKPPIFQTEHSRDSLRGGIAAMSKNASKYVIQTSGRASNILNIFDKTNRSSLGNPRWWIRFDRPHGNVNYPHININKAVTGIKDPHIQISPTTAKTVGYFGKVAEKANDYAPILTTAAVIYESYQIGKEVKKDYEYGTTRNTIKRVATTTATYTSGSIGACAGATIGSSIFPGIGTIFGGIVGGVLGGYYGGHYSHVASEKALNHIEWDVAVLECNGCREEYTWKKYQEIQGVCCEF